MCATNHELLLECILYKANSQDCVTRSFIVTVQEGQSDAAIGIYKANYYLMESIVLLAIKMIM